MAKKKAKVEPTGLIAPILNSPGRRCSVIGIALTFLAVVAIAGLDEARHRLRGQLQESRPFTLTATDSPEWVTVDLVADLQATLDQDADERTAQAVSRRLEEHRWVRSAKIHRTRNGFHADVDYREPVLAVNCLGRCCYVDREGAALDAGTLAARAGAQCLLLEGIESRQPPTIGEPLAEGLIIRAAELAGRLSAVRDPLALDSLILKVDKNDPQIEILSRRGGLILWGSLKEPDGPKLAHLVEQTRTGLKVHEGQRIDLRRPRPALEPEFRPESATSTLEPANWVPTDGHNP